MKMLLWSRNFRFSVSSFWFYKYENRTLSNPTSEFFKSFLFFFLYHCKMSPVSYPTASILLILSIVFGFSEACSSRSASKIRPPHVARPNVTYLTYPCPKGPAERLCLNGGTCFTLFENSTDFFCKCAEGYCGATCADKYTQNGCYSSSSSSSLVIMASSGIPRPPETFPCPPGPAEWLCLNGGTCFTVFENATDFACHCTEGFCGLTCGEKYTRYGCFSRYLVISASTASAGTVAVIFVVVFVISYVYYQKKTASDDAELRIYFERSINTKYFVRMQNQSMSLTADKLENSNKNESEPGKEAKSFPMENYTSKKEDLNDETFFNNYLNLIRLI